MIRRARTLLLSRVMSRRRVPIRFERLGVSARVSPWTVSLTLLLTLGCVFVGAWSMTLGVYPISVGEVFLAAVGFPAAPQDTFIIIDLRLPRVLVALFAGGALAASGAIFQALVRNPLAAPDIIGVNSGAGAVVVLLIVTGAPAALIAPGAFAGAIGAASAVYLLTWRHGISGARLVLVGIGVNAMLSALITLMIVRFPVDRATLAVWWQSGTLHGSDAGDAWLLVGSLAVLLPAGMWLVRSANVLSFGDDAARGLGLRVERARFGMLTVGAAMAAVAIAAAGPIGFVALISPHIARMIAGSFTAGVLLLSGAIGAAMVLIADIVAQHAFAFPVPVGILTAAVDAPYFIYLLARAGRRARS